MTRVPRQAGLSAAAFLERHLVANQPVIVTGVAEAWPAQGRWTPEFLLWNFGKRYVQVYDQLFALVDMTTLSDFLGRNFGKAKGGSNEYVRWCSKLRNVEIPWSDEVFDALASDWEHPAFLPTSSYVLPYCPPSVEVSATRDLFPYRGLFISARGGRTRLHRDPLGSQAVLWQVHGQKSLTFYAPHHDALLRDGDSFVDPLDPDLGRFPGFAGTRPTYEDILAPGEILFIPDGWFHDVVSITDSISVTWNMVHRARLQPFINVLANDEAGSELDIARFFLSSQVGLEATSEEILGFLEDKQSQ